MALTITPLTYYQYGKCDALADLEGTWTGNSAGTESDFYKEGAGCLGFTIRTVGQNDITYPKATGTWDLSGVKHLRIWFLCSTPNAINIDDPADPANAGIQFFVGDASVTAYYKVSGKTSYPGGWYNLVVDLSSAADSGTKPTNMLCTKIGIRINMTAAPKNVDNVWIDNLIICDGLALESDSQFGFQEIFDKDNDTTGAWGVIRKISGVYYLTGKLQAGIGSGSNACDFKDISQTIVFENRKVNSALYGINITGGSSGVTKIQMGDKSGAAGISGCGVRVQSLTQTSKFTITSSALGANDIFKFYGCNFLNAGIITCPSINGTNREVLNCAFEKCAELLADTCIVANCNFISSAGRAIKISSETHNVTYCNFINCQTAVHHNIGGPTDAHAVYLYDALLFTGGTYHIENSATAPNYYIDVSRLHASNPDEAKINNSGGGSTTILPLSVTLTVTVKDTGGNPIELAQVAIYKSSDNTPLMNEDTNVQGIATEPFEYLADTDVYIRVRKASSGATKYIPHGSTGKITDTGLNITVTLYEEPLT